MGRWPAPAGPVPPKPRSAGTAVSAGVLALITALLYGGYSLLAMVAMLNRAGPEDAMWFGVAVVGNLLAVVGAILLFAEKRSSVVVLLAACVVIAGSSVLLATLPIKSFLSTDDPHDPRMLIHLICILPAAVIALLVLLPSTRRYLSSDRGAHTGYPAAPVAPMPPDPTGKAMAIGGSVCGLLLGLIMLSVVLDTGLGYVDILFLLQAIGVILAVVGGLVTFGRKWAGGLLLAVGGGISLGMVLLALFRGGGGEIDFRSAIFLLSAIGAVTLPLLPPTKRYLRTG